MEEGAAPKFNEEFDRPLCIEKKNLNKLIAKWDTHCFNDTIVRLYTVENNTKKFINNLAYDDGFDPCNNIVSCFVTFCNETQLLHKCRIDSIDGFELKDMIVVTKIHVSNGYFPRYFTGIARIKKGMNIGNTSYKITFQ
jgi:hypothetical protein